MTKIKLTCVECGRRIEWYKSFWQEVMEYKISDNEYLCIICASKLHHKAFAEYVKAREKRVGGLK